MLTLVRLGVVASVPLAPDEAYYWVWSRTLAPGFLDAPPMVALWIRTGAAIAGPTALGIRLLGPVSGAIGSVLLWDAARLLLPGPSRALAAATLLNATLLMGVGTVVMTPDTPLLFFWVCCLWALARFLAEQRGYWLIGAGLLGGLALVSKYTAILIAPAVILWLLLLPELRPWLTRPALWFGALGGALLFLPVVLWNASHDWASFAKQGGRFGDWHPAAAPRFLLELIVGQIGLATPLIFALCVAGAAQAVRLGARRDPAWTLLALMTLIPAAVFVQHGLGDRVQANWPTVLYPTAAIAAAGLVWNRWVQLRGPAVVLGLAITGAVYLQAVAAPFPLPPRFDATALQLADWRGLADRVDVVRRKVGATFVASDDYGQAAELALALPLDVPVIGEEPRWALFDLPRPDLEGSSGLLVHSLRRGPAIDRAPWAEADPIGETVRTRHGVVVERFELFRVIARPSPVPLRLLPRP